MGGCCCVHSSASKCRRTKGVPGLPVDVGWAWVVAAAGACVFGMQTAAFKMTGMFYIQMVDHFHSDPKTTFWVTCVSGMVSLYCAPLVAVILQKTSHRTVVIIGSICTTVGCITTGVVPMMEATFITIGVIFAFGITCLFVGGLTCTVPYFDKYRGLAVGITSAGGGLLSFFVPIVFSKLLDVYTFAGAMLMYGGTFLQLLIIALLIRPVSLYRKRHPGTVGLTSKMATFRPERAHCGSSEDMQKANFELAKECPRNYVMNDQHYSETAPNEKVSVGQRPSSLTDASVAGHAYNLEPLDDNDVPQLEEHGAKDIPVSSHPAKQSLDLSLIRDARMLIIAFAMFFFNNSMSIVFGVIPPYGDSVGMERQTISTLIAMGGIFEVVFRCLHGWFSDRHLVSALLQMGLCCGLTGVAALLCPIVGGAVGVGLLSAFCGIAGTSVQPLIILVIRELLGDDKMASAMGIQLFFQGSSYAVSAYMTGYLREQTGAWNAIFYYIAANYAIAFVLCMGYSVVRKTREKKDTL